MTGPVRVIKVGGSLLDFDELVPRLRAWLSREPEAVNVVLGGGGRMADAVRDAFGRFDLAEEHAHWLCIRVLGVTAELLARLFPGSVLVRDFAALRATRERKELVVFDPEQYLREVEPGRSGAPLPHTWDVTSDSIAARLADHLGAAEVVLLKSTSAPERTCLHVWAAAGFVDRHFPCAAGRLPAVRAVNLRDPDMPEGSWHNLAAPRGRPERGACG